MYVLRNSKNVIKRFFALFVIAIFFATSFVVIFQNIGSETISADFDAFYSSLMSMFEYDEVVLGEEEYILSDEDVLVTETVATQYSLQTYQSDIEGFYIVENCNIEEDSVVTESTTYNRLIIYYDGTLDSYGAVLTAEIDNLHIFQYENAEDTASAYEYYSSLNLSVSYDALVTLEDYTVEEVYEETTVSTSYTNPWTDKTFNSWGASYVGYASYVENMCARNDSLNEVVVVVIDSGINTSHVLFEDRILYNYGKNFTTETSTSGYEFEDLSGHGTHVSGIIAESTLDNVKILPLKVLDSEGSGKVSYITAAYAYVKTLADTLNIKVINLSIGVTDSDGKGTTNSSLINSIEELYDEKYNILSVVSAGNERMDTETCSPANAPNAITVSAVAQSGSSVVFAYSYSNYGDEVDLCAPGTSIYSAYIGSSTRYATLSGTSMAAPHVTAAVALLYSNPALEDIFGDGEELTPSLVTSKLKEFAIDYGDEGDDIYYGAGLVNVADIGAVYYGYVTFSRSGGEYDQQVTLALSLSGVRLEGLSNNYTIYYSLESYDGEGSQDFVEYTSPIQISSTTKVTAYAKYGNEVYEKYGYEATYTSSELYIFGYYDVLSNYEFTLTDDGYVLTAYSGTLTTLILPSTYNGKDVVALGEYAFNGTNVTTLTLPDSIKTINAYAFKDNTKITTIRGGTVEVGDYAFYGASNLKTMDVEITYIGDYSFYNCKKLTALSVENVTYLGSRALAYCSSLTSLQLYDVNKIGDYAISVSGVTEIWIGKNISSIGSQESLSITTVYGYSGTASEIFAYVNNFNFVDLTLQFTKDLNSEVYILSGSNLTIDFDYSGLEVTATIYKNGSTYTEITSGLTYTLVGLSNDDKIYIELVDYYGETVQSNTLTVYTLEEGNSISVSYDSTGEQAEEYFDVYVNGNLISSGDLFASGEEITIVVEAKEGYVLTSVQTYINSENQEQLSENNTTCEFTVSESDDVIIIVTVAPIEELDVTFSFTDGSAQIYVDDSLVEDSYTINRGDELTFKIVADSGYDFSYVLVDGYSLILEEEGYDEDGNCYRIYTIENVVTNVEVFVVLTERVYSIQIIHGSGGTVSWSGSDETYSNSQVFIISASEGYQIDFVSINGQIVEVSNNTIILNDISEDYEIVISFKKISNSFFSGPVAIYFIIFIAIFIIFIIARIILHFVRKKNDKWMTSSK